MEEDVADIELPKDAEGREIPLDTARLFSASGNAHNITQWVYDTDSYAGGGAAGRWRADTDTFERLDPGLMYLTPHDSWERLGEDLHAVEVCGDSPDLGDPVCAYARNIGKKCVECKLYVGDCTVNMCRDIASRIDGLRGEGK